MYNQTIADYIKAQKAKGVQEAAIMQALEQAGWQKADVDATLQKLNTADDSPAPMNEPKIERPSQQTNPNPNIIQPTQAGSGSVQPQGDAARSEAAPQSSVSQSGPKQFLPENGGEKAESVPPQTQPPPIVNGGASRVSPGFGSSVQNFGNDSFNSRSTYVSNPLLVLKNAFQQPKKAWLSMGLLSLALALIVSVAYPYIAASLLAASFGFLSSFVEPSLDMILLFLVGLPLLITLITSSIWVGYSKIALTAELPEGNVPHISFKNVLSAIGGTALTLILAALIFFGLGMISGLVSILGLLMIPVGIYIYIRYARIVSLLPFHQMYEKKSFLGASKAVLNLSKKHVIEILGFLAVIQLASMLFTALFAFLSSSAITALDSFHPFILGLTMFITYFPVLLLIGVAAFGCAYRYLSLRQLEAGKVTAVRTHPLNYVMIAVLVLAFVGSIAFSAMASNEPASFSAEEYNSGTTIEYDNDDTYDDLDRRQEASITASELEQYAANNGMVYPLSLDELYSSSSYYEEPETIEYMNYTPRTSSGAVCSGAAQCSDYDLSVELTDGTEYEL